MDEPLTDQPSQTGTSERDRAPRPDDPSELGEPPGPTSGSGLWPWLRGLAVTRGPDHWVGGVCAAVAARIGIDPLLVRVLALVLALFGGAGLLAYAAAWLLLPDRSGRIEAQQLLRGSTSTPALVALSLAVVAVLVPAPWQWWSGGVLVGSGEVLGAVVVTVVVVVLLTWLPGVVGGRAPSGGCDGGRGRPVQPAAVRFGVLGLALVASGLAWWVLAGSGVPAPLVELLPGRVVTGPVTGPPLVAAVLAVATAVLAAGLLLAGLRGRSGAGTSGLAVTAALCAATALLVPPSLDVDPVADVPWVPTQVATAERGYGAVVGGLEVDLRGLPLAGPGGPVVVPVRALLGDVRVQVPAGASVEVRGRVGAGVAGEVEDVAAGWSSEGREGGFLGDVRTERVATDGGRRLVVDAALGMGRVEVVGAEGAAAQDEGDER